jgi:HNH endonuclease
MQPRTEYVFEPVIVGKCVDWKGPVDRHGYGRRGGRQAHRIAYEQAFGPIPRGLEIDHLCRRRSCVNPDHLEAVTHRVNCDRAKRSCCRRGHPYNEANTYITPRGNRQCRRCQLLAVYRYRYRRGLSSLSYPSTESRIEVPASPRVPAPRHRHRPQRRRKTGRAKR